MLNGASIQAAQSPDRYGRGFSIAHEFFTRDIRHHLLYAFDLEHIHLSFLVVCLLAQHGQSHSERVREIHRSRSVYKHEHARLRRISCLMIHD